MIKKRTKRKGRGNLKEAKQVEEGEIGREDWEES